MLEKSWFVIFFLFFLKEIKAGSEGDQLGFKKGDVIDSINGIKVDTETKLKKFSSALMGVDSYTFVVFRDDNTFFISFFVFF